MTKEDQEISNAITEATIKLQYKEGIRSATHMLTLPQIVGGVAGITAVVALGASGFIPLLPLVATVSPTSQIVLNWLAGLGGNALAGWLTNWAGKGASIVFSDEQSQQKLLEQLTQDLQANFVADEKLREELATLLEQTDSISVALDALASQPDAQKELREALQADLRRSDLIQGRLHHLLSRQLQAFEFRIQTKIESENELTRDLMRSEAQAIREDIGHLQSRQAESTILLDYDHWGHEQNQWLTQCFQSEAESRAHFGQILNIAQHGIRLIERHEAWQKLDSWLDSWETTRRSIAVVGEEGDGKTWAVASWVQRKIVQDADCPPVVFISSAEIETNEPQDLLLRVVAQHAPALSKEHVQKSLVHWLQTSDRKRPLFLLVLDGINERYDVPWWRTLLEKLNSTTWRSVVAVMITCRTGYWQYFSALRSITTARYILPPYNDHELSTALEGYSLRREDIQPELLELARKPRYLDLLIQHRERIAESGDVTVARLIYEDWRDRWERKRSLPLNDSDFQNLLRDLADKYLMGEQSIRKKQLIELLPFATEQVVEELRTSGVFRENNGRYEVQRPHLVLGLALVLVDQVEAALHSSRDLTETIAVWLEPHAAMDIKAHICEAAALRALHIPDFPVSAKAALLRAWMTSQNVEQQVERNLSAYFPIDPKSYFELAEGIWCDLIDHRWGQKVLMNIFLHWIKQQHAAHLPLWQATFQRWLGFVPRSGYPFLSRRTDEKKLKVQQAIAERLGFELQPGPFALSGYQLTAIDDDGLLRLGRAALALISHVPREPFIHAIATGCVAEAINDYPNKYSEFAWVIRTSQQPLWNAVQVEVERLLGSNNRIAQQAAYHLLSFVGSTEAHDLQARLPQDLFPPDPAVEQHAADPCVSVFSWSREDCERCVARTDIASHRIARRIQAYCIDPNLQVPEDLGTRLAPLAETIDIQSMHTGTWQTSADHTFEEYEPALCAYAPEALANVVHRLVRQIAEREGMALRQISIFLKDYSIILTQEELHSIYQVWSTLQQTSTSGDENAEDAEMFLFFRVLQYLGAQSQLTHVLSRPREALDLINYEHYFLPITDWDVVWQQLTDAPNTETIVRILWFLSPHATIIPHQDVVTRILPLLTHDDSLVRRTALRIIFGCSAEIAIEEFIRGPWAWSSTNHKEENHWGSLILCEHGHQLPFLDILRRVHPVYLGHAVCCRGNKTEEIEVYADALHQQWLRLGPDTPDIPVDFPPISVETFPTNDHITHFHRYRLEKQDQEPITFSNDTWGGENETYVSGLQDMMSEDADARRQEQRQESTHRVKETIEQQLAEGNTWFAHRFFPDALEQVVHIRPDLVEQWVAGVWNEQLAAIRRLQLGSTFYEALCETLLEVSPEQGTRLYWYLQTVPMYVFTRDSRSGIELLDYALFRSQPTEAIQQDWNKRLEQCRTDQELLQVTIAAQAGQGQDWLQSYINRALQSDVPITQMRAMTLLGLTDTEANVEQLGELRTQMPDTWKRELVDTSLDRSQRNMWAKHWFRRFLTVPNDVEAWAAFGLFLRCVDQRFWLWYEHIVAEIESDDVLSPRVRFLEENMDTINNKVKKNQDTIKKQFLGQKVKRGEMWPWMR